MNWVSVKLSELKFHFWEKLLTWKTISGQIDFKLKRLYKRLNILSVLKCYFHTWILLKNTICTTSSIGNALICGEKKNPILFHNKKYFSSF